MYPEQPTKVFKSSRPNRKIFEFFEKFQLWKYIFYLTWTQKLVRYEYPINLKL